MDLGQALLSVPGRRSSVIVLGGVFLVLCGVGLGLAKTPMFAIVLPGLLMVHAGLRRRTVVIHESGIAYGRQQIAYEELRSVIDRRPMSARLLAAQAKGRTSLGDDGFAVVGKSPLAIYLPWTPEVVAQVEQLIVPAGIERWRRRLDRGETYKSAEVEVTKNECWVPAYWNDDGFGPPVLLPHYDTRIVGYRAYRGDRAEHVAEHPALSYNVMLRGLIASYGVSVK